jgi:hypothetical protein
MKKRLLSLLLALVMLVGMIPATTIAASAALPIDGVEPVLMKLLDGIAVCKTKGGGSD